MKDLKSRIKDSVLDYVRTDYIAVSSSKTVEETIAQIRSLNTVNRISYIYAVNEEGRLAGVVQTRDLIMADPKTPLLELMIKRVISIPEEATVFEACEFFVLYKLMAYPVVNIERRVVGVVDVSMLTDELLDFAERKNVDDVFETIGFRMDEIRNAGTVKSWKIRFPWMLGTLISGLVCAMVASYFAQTLKEQIMLAFFMTLVLGLGESLSVQSMTLTIQRLHIQRPTRRWVLGMLATEGKVAVLIGLSACSLTAGAVMLAGAGRAVVVAVSSSIFLTLIGASAIGILIPSLLHAFNMDPKVSSGPITLAITDIITISTFLGIGTWVLS